MRNTVRGPCLHALGMDVVPATILTPLQLALCVIVHTHQAHRARDRGLLPLYMDLGTS